jgi:hypothetical protein
MISNFIVHLGKNDFAIRTGNSGREDLYGGAYGEF